MTADSRTAERVPGDLAGIRIGLGPVGRRGIRLDTSGFAGVTVWSHRRTLRKDGRMIDALPDWLLAELTTVPHYEAFAGVDELHAGLRRIAEHYPGIASLRRCGSSRQGDPLWCLTVERR